MKPTPQRNFVALWGWPIALAVLSATGLATALVSDTWGDWWSWVGLGVPVAVMGWYAWPRTCAPAARPAATHSLADDADAARTSTPSAPR